MANLKDIKRRIGSVKSTQKITNAMKLVSAAKFARANAAVEASRPYSRAFKAMVDRLIQSEGQDIDSALLKESKEEKVLLVVFATDRGLCGGLNSNLFKRANEFIRTKNAEGTEVDLFACGRRAISFAKKQENRCIEKMEKVLEKPSVTAARDLAHSWVGLFKDQSYQAVYILYPKFKSALEQFSEIDRVLPLQLEVSDEATNPVAPGDLIVEPAFDSFIDSLLEKKLLIEIYEALLNGAASEHGARMTAMDSATSNARDVIKKLTLQYNRARQAAITTELTEIISGAEALN